MQQSVQAFLDNPAEDKQWKVDDGFLWLQQRGGRLFALAELPSDPSPDEAFLTRALQLTAPALRHYGRHTAALALKENSLVLMLSLHETHADKVCVQLESLLNQRDVWQSLLLKHQRKVTTHGTVPLHSLAFLPRERNHG